MRLEDDELQTDAMELAWRFLRDSPKAAQEFLDCRPGHALKLFLALDEKVNATLDLDARRRFWPTWVLSALV